MHDCKELRKITRVVLLFIAIVIHNNSFETKELIQYLQNNTCYFLNDKLFLRSLLSNSFEEQQRELLKVIEDSGCVINEKIKNHILSNVN